MAMATLSSAAAVAGLGIVAQQQRTLAASAARFSGASRLGVSVKAPDGVRISVRLTNPGFPSRQARIMCQASEKEMVSKARKYQMQATELLAELLKSNDVKATAQEHVNSLSEDFFIIASTYLEMAKKEGNAEVVTKLETTLQTALSVKEATLRPEIQLLNQLLRDKTDRERSETIQKNLRWLSPQSYFFQLLTRMIGDVEKQTNNPNRLRLLAHLRMVNKETREVSRAMKKKPSAE